MKLQRVPLNHQPFDSARPNRWTERGLWPAHWISIEELPQSPVVVAYRLTLSLTQPLDTVIHVTADERYELHVDGELAGRGPERGDPENWFFESYRLHLAPGEHTLVATVWSLGEQAPYAQMSVGHGLLLAPEDSALVPMLATGAAPWQAKVLPGFSWHSPLSAWGTGANQAVHAAEYAWGFESGAGEGWISVVSGMVGGRHGSNNDRGKQHYLRPAMLPPQINRFRQEGSIRFAGPFQGNSAELPIRQADNDEELATAFGALITKGQPVTIAPNSNLRVLLDLNEYYCGRTHLEVSGGQGARLEVDWTEGLYLDTKNWDKGHRDEVEGKLFVAGWKPGEVSGDVFYPDGTGKRTFRPLWWQAGRYQQLQISTGEAPLTLHAWGHWETRYPLEMEGTWSSSAPELDGLVPMMVRGLQMCSHETYMDCPFYEQMMYVGDTRLEVLVTYCLTRDEALPRKALKLFDWSRLISGLTQSRYPCWVRQVIPPFSLWWVAMCHDYALWRGDAEFTRSLLPGVRAVCDHFAGLINEDGLLTAPDGWNFMDWVKTTEEQLKYAGGDPRWGNGVPPGANYEISGILNWQASLVFRLAGELEGWFGEPELSKMQHRRSRELAAATDAAFWNEEKGLYADDLSHDNWSEHAQCLAVLSRGVPPHKIPLLRENLLTNPDLARTTIYFSHYLLETFRELDCMEAFFNRLTDWQELAQNGLKTTIEMPEPTRSDCHAWGAHPLFHFYASIAGIRPAGPSFQSVRVGPVAAEWLAEFQATLPHPRGEVQVSRTATGTQVRVPEGVAIL